MAREAGDELPLPPLLGKKIERLDLKALVGALLRNGTRSRSGIFFNLYKHLFR